MFPHTNTFIPTLIPLCPLILYCVPFDMAPSSYISQDSKNKPSHVFKHFLRDKMSHIMHHSQCAITPSAGGLGWVRAAAMTPFPTVAALTRVCSSDGQVVFSPLSLFHFRWPSRWLPMDTDTRDAPLPAFEVLPNA